MNPIFIILYVVIVTVLLAIFFPRLRKTNRRLSWILLTTGLAGLLVMAMLMFTR